MVPARPDFYVLAGQQEQHVVAYIAAWPCNPLQDPAAAQPRVRMGPPRKQEMHGPVDELKAFAVKRELPRTPAGHDQ